MSSGSVRGRRARLMGSGTVSRRSACRRAWRGDVSETIVPDQPFGAVAVGEELGAGEEEEPPALEPEPRGRRPAVGARQDRERLGAAPLEVGEPGLGGPRV